MLSYPIFLSLLAQNVMIDDTAFLGRVGEVELGAAAIGKLLYLHLYDCLRIQYRITNSDGPQEW